MNNELLNTEIDKLSQLYESLKDVIYVEIHPLRVNTALALLTSLRDQSATNIQQLAKVDADAERKAEKWDNLYQAIESACYDDEGNEIPGTDLTTIGEMTATRMNFF